MRTQSESECVSKGRRNRLQLVADRGVRVLRQAKTFSGAIQGLMNDTLSTPTISEISRADNICDYCI